MERGGNGAAVRVVVAVFAIVVIGGAIVYASRQFANAPRPPVLSLPALPTAGPTATPTIVTSGMVIRQMQAVQRLETTRYTIESVVEATTPGTRFTSGEKLLLIAHGTVVVGFDLARLTADDVTVSPDGKSVTVLLPPAEIFSAGLEDGPGKTRVYERDSGKTLAVFPQGSDPNLETAARRQGLAQIVQTACDDGIAARANQDGTVALQNLLALAGFETVRLQVRGGATPGCPGGQGAPASPTR